jgi:hypothetical protein
MKKGSNDATYYDARYNGYSGKKRFEVAHPRHAGRLTIAAPDMNSAVVAAAQRWGEKWSAYDFYAFCHVLEVKGGK